VIATQTRVRIPVGVRDQIISGKDCEGGAHFLEIVPKFEPRDDKSETAQLIPGSGIIVRRFEPMRSNPWHHAPGRYAVFTLSGAVDIEIEDGTVRRLGSGRHLDRRGLDRAGARDA
jgi:hypothetical protein